MNSLLIKKFLLPLLITIGALIFQGTVLRYIWPSASLPNIPLILFVFLGFFEPTAIGAVTVFVLALIVDIGSGILIGPNAAAAIFVFGLLAFFTKLLIDSPFAIGVAVFICSLLNSAVYAALVGQFGSELSRSVWGLLIEALLTAILAPVCFALLKRVILIRERPAQRGLGRTRPRFVT